MGVDIKNLAADNLAKNCRVIFLISGFKFCLEI